MQIFFQIQVLVVLCLGLSACNSLMQDIQVDAEIDPQARISGYKSYDWIDDDAMLLLNDPEGKWQAPNIDVANEIKLHIDKELSKRGILTDPENPELFVGFFMGVDMQAMQLKYDPKFDVEILQKIPTAGLIVVLIDTTTEFVVWMGTAEAEVHANANDEQLSQRVEFAVQQMFKLLPAD